MKELSLGLSHHKVICGCLLLLFANAFAQEQALSVGAATEEPGAGVQAYVESRYEDAKEFFLKNSKSSADKNESLMYLGWIALAQGDEKLAVRYIDQALAITPNESEELLAAGDIYCNQAKLSSIFTAIKLAKKCIAHYESAVQLDNTNVEALVAATRFHLSTPSIAGGSSTRGKEHLDRLQQISPEHATIYKINQLEQEGKSDAAIQLAEALSSKARLSVTNQYDLAHFYRNKKLFAQAKPHFEVVAAAPVTIKTKWHINDSLLQLGEIAIVEGDFTKGIELIEKYQSKNQNPHDDHYFWASWSLAKAYKAIGNVEKYELLINQIKSQDYRKDKAFAKEFEANI